LNSCAPAQLLFERVENELPLLVCLPIFINDEGLFVDFAADTGDASAERRSLQRRADGLADGVSRAGTA
jgi:hypothetical protein